ncbi:MAG: PAS domain S-box protein, partial [Pseudolabrys sp.]
SASLDLSWRESGGPRVHKPERAGFGTLVIERNLTMALGARVAVSYASDGFRCDIHIPASQNLATR